jgi:hypothetical protein
MRNATFTIAARSAARASVRAATWAGLAWAGLSACGSPPENQPPPDPGCALETPAEKTPGYPFDPKLFRDQVWPVLAGSCMGSGCHSGPNGIGNFSVWAVSDDQCDFVNTFEQVAAQTDLDNRPENSRVYLAVAGSKPGHVSLQSKPAELQVLLDYARDAFDRKQKDNPTRPGVSFDLAHYQTEIDPLFAKNGCLIGGCHDPDGNGGGFSLAVGPALDSDEMEANFDQVVLRTETGQGKAGASLSEIYVRTQNVHYNASFAPADAAKLLDWISAAIPDTGEVPKCTDSARFNLGVFNAEIMPILDGRLDLEDRGGGVGPGCTRCHAARTGPGQLHLVEGAPAAENLERFACFVNLDNPSASLILACPLDQSNCPAPNGHPGGDIFVGVQDLNYQRILSYLYAATANSPLDFAFYVRKIDPLLNDPNSVQDGALRLSCSDTVACHGITRQGSEPPNFSNFGIFPESTDPQELVLNYASASNFTHFQQADQSALILYPTNEIANVDNPLGTGTRHPVTAFDLDDAETAVILEWAGGLRTTDAGFVRHWLVAGDYGASEVNDEVLLGEEDVRPSIFEDAGAAERFNLGLWDGFFSDADFIDLNDAEQGFFVAGGANRVVLAVAYLINTGANDIDAQITVTSPNDVELFVGDTSNLGVGGNVSLRAKLPAFAPDVELTRVLVKVFQAPGEDQFGFTLQVTDERNNILGNQLLIKLSPEGSI